MSITVLLIFTSLFGVGLNAPKVDDLWQVQVENVVLQSQKIVDVDFPEYKDQGLIGAGGGVVYIEDDDGEEIAFVSLEPGFLKEQTFVTMRITDEVVQDGYSQFKLDGDETVTPIGPRIEVNFSFSAIDLNSSSPIIFVSLPYENAYDRDNNNSYDYRVLLGNGQEFKGRALIDLETGAAIMLSANSFNTPLWTDNLPQDYRFIFQPVTVSKLED